MVPNEIKLKQIDFSGSVDLDDSNIASKDWVIDAISNLSGSSGSGLIGTPDDGTYTDGFFQWETNEKVSNAFDDLNELMLALVPTKPSDLAGQNLSYSVSSFSGKFANGAAIDDFLGASYYTNYTFTDSDTYNFTTPGSPYFYVGRTGYLEVGPLSVQTASQQETLNTVNTRSYQDGTGINGILNLSSISLFNTIWKRGEASVTITNRNSVTGSFKITLDDGLSGITNEVHLYQLNGITPPVISNGPGAAVITETIKYLSGIEHYYRGTTFDIDFTVDNLYNPVYQNTVAIISTNDGIFNNISISAPATPSINDQLSASETVALLDDKSLGTNSGSYSTTIYKPNVANVSSGTKILGNKRINTYATESTNGPSTWNEYFLDEDKRYTNQITATWDPSAALVNGQLQVQNGILRHANDGDYSGFSLSQYYYRVFTPDPAGPAKEQGTITINRTGFPSFVSEWNSVGLLQMGFYLANDPLTIYDLGRVVNNNSGPNIKGIRNGSISGETITWALVDGAQATGVNPLILVIKITNTGNTNYINQLNLTWI